MADTTEISAGVQELIDKLRNQGVHEGQQQAKKIIKEAQNEASRIVSQGKADADKLFSEAYHKIEVERSSAHEAIKIAFRDTELALRSKFRETFSAYLKRLVSIELGDKDFIRQLVLVMAGLKTAEAAQANQIEILLPARRFESDEGGAHLSKDGKERLRHLVLGITGDMLREGVELNLSPDFDGGIKVRLIGEDLQIDLSDEALSCLLLKNLLPRYREIVSGQE